MMIKLLTLTFCFFLACGAFCYGQKDTTIISQYFAAIGGFEKRMAVQTFVSRGKQVSGGAVSHVTTTIDEGKLWRQDIKSGGIKSFSLISAHGAWSYQNGNLVKLNNSLATKEKATYFLEAALYQYKAPGFFAKLIKTDTADEKVCYQIMISATPGDSITCWFDTSTHLLIKTSVTTSIGIGQNDGSIKDLPIYKNTIYRDYKAIDGLVFPFTYINYGVSLETGNVIRTVNYYVSNIKINPSLEESLYRPE